MYRAMDSSQGYLIGEKRGRVEEGGREGKGVGRAGKGSREGREREREGREGEREGRESE